MTGINCDLFTHSQSRSYLNHLLLLSKISKYKIRVISYEFGKNVLAHDE